MAAGDQRWEKADRLRLRRDFLAVQQRGARFQLKDLLVFVRETGGELRLGLTVSAKVGHAVCRNRVKRWLREAWRRRKVSAPNGYDVVIVARRSAALAGYEVLEAQVSRFVGWLDRRARGSQGAER